MLKALKSDFEKSDKNKDGKLSKNEFHSFMKSQGYNLPDNEILIMV
jgi:Ca2+-binding EF-hand superfamily protein